MRVKKTAGRPRRQHSLELGPRHSILAVARHDVFAHRRAAAGEGRRRR